MDLDADGHADILSGSYSRKSQDMAGLFQVLRGLPDGGFRKAETLCGTDGEPLIIVHEPEELLERICTRPTAADLNGDGHLDLVVGNMKGNFAFFQGEGKGRFAPQCSILRAGGQPLRVPAHGDPFLVDWDADGDLDLLSGSDAGGVFLCRNTGSPTAPAFAQAQALLPECRSEGTDGTIVLGDAHLRGPQRSTRVWADDLNGDGRLDLLVGDNVTLYTPLEGQDPKDVDRRLAEWKEEEQSLTQEFAAATAMDEKLQEKWSAHWNSLEEFLHVDRTGFVWVLHQKNEQRSE